VRQELRTKRQDKSGEWRVQSGKKLEVREKRKTFVHLPAGKGRFVADDHTR